ncbi:alpha amylase, catalytic domain protein [Enterococcus faecalis 13-SD-W-01]|nr:alpha amylase, catalytic domain protein [Enterococcus faecalis 13-SD-W-01]
MYEQLLIEIYHNKELSIELSEKIKQRVTKHKKLAIKSAKQHWDEQDLFLITYADQFSEEGQANLVSFRHFYQKYLSELFNIVHFLPFFPYTSDDGFSVVDYQKIDEKNGTWEDLEMFKETRLMFDFVCNHLSAKSIWFQEYLALNPEYKDFFIDLDPTIDLSKVTRPRTSPLLTKFEDKNREEKNIWTTFSADQVDVNFKNPEVLLRMIDILLFYLEKGAEFIRLDAVGFLWKTLGTSCIHLPETHKIIQVFRKVVDEAAPGTILITETNVPHKDNISYFGDGSNEAQMVYQFPLPPLVLYAIHTGNTTYLKNWASSLEHTKEGTTFFNFLASHDGIGLNPIRGIVPETEIQNLVEELKKEGALVNYKKNPNGTTSPYEINVTYLDALSAKKDEDELRKQRFLLAHALLVAVPGIPAIYIQSILGSRNDYDGVEKTGENRSINRKKYELDEIREELENTPLRKMVYHGLSEIVGTRKTVKAFHPDAEMIVQESNNQIVAFIRKIEEEQVLAIYNFSNELSVYKLPDAEYWDLFNKRKFEYRNEVQLQPYQYLWLKIKKEVEK